MIIGRGLVWSARRRGVLPMLALMSSACGSGLIGEPSQGAPGSGESSDLDPTHPNDGPNDDPASDRDAGGGQTEPACTGIASVGAPVPLRRLTAVQVERTVASVLGVQQRLTVTDEKLFHYRSNVSTSIDSAAARSYLDFAEASVASADLSRCASASCLDWLLDDVGLRLFRRPLDATERQRYSSLHELGGAEGPRWVLEAMLQSPRLLYLDETVDADGLLDDYSLAARLALVVWGESPDAELLQRASDGLLSTAADVREEAMRMLADPRSLNGLSDFVDQWLELERLVNADERPDIAALGAETVAAMRDEPVQLFARLLQSGGNLQELLSTTETVRTDLLQPLYGADILSSDADSFSLDPARRGGVMALPGVMAALSHAEVTSPTRRGYAVLSSLLCTPPPPPPPGVNVTLPDVGPNATARERLEAHFESDVCGSCHRQMDGIGFAFEGIDWLGRSRTEDHGKPIDDDASFELGSTEVDVKGVAELADALAKHADVAQCVATQWARYATGIPETAEARCLMERLGADIAGPTGLSTMMLTYLTSDWFRRGNGVAP